MDLKPAGKGTAGAAVLYGESALSLVSRAYPVAELEQKDVSRRRTERILNQVLAADGSYALRRDVIGSFPSATGRRRNS
jgi:hypothetical protein